MIFTPVNLSPTLFALFEKIKSPCFFLSVQAPKLCTIKKLSRFELYSRLYSGKANVAGKLRLELLQVVIQEDVPPELLSFVLSFQKRKYIKFCRFTKTHFLKKRRKKLHKLLPSLCASSLCSRRSLQWCFARLQISIKAKRKTSLSGGFEFYADFIRRPM